MSDNKPKMPLRVQVMTTNVDHRSGVSDKTGKDWEINEQEVWSHLPSAPFPQKTSIRLDNKNSAHPEGDYILDVAECLTVDRFGKLAIDDRKIKLLLVKAANS